MGKPRKRRRWHCSSPSRTPPPSGGRPQGAFKEKKANERGILPLLLRATLLQTFGQTDHVCGLPNARLHHHSFIPPYVSPLKMKTHFVPPETPRSIFVYICGRFYDAPNDPEVGYFARGVHGILRKQRLLANPSMKQAMLFPQPSQPGDAFHHILNSLARKLPHDKGVYLTPCQKVLNWTEGPEGDLKPW